MHILSYINPAKPTVIEGIQADIRRSSAMKILIFIFGEYCLALTTCRS
jgi:hypothetical protein